MEGLPRSTTSFRRQGSSGLVWDDKYLSGDLSRFRTHKGSADDDDINKQKAAGMLQRSRSEGGSGGGGGGVGLMHRAMKEPPPALDPPSPKVSGCGLCGFFGKPVAAHKPNKSNRRKSTKS